MIERYNIVKRIKTSSGIIGNGHPGSWQPLRGTVLLLARSVVNSSIRYWLFDEEPDMEGSVVKVDILLWPCAMIFELLSIWFHVLWTLLLLLLTIIILYYYQYNYFIYCWVPTVFITVLVIVQYLDCRMWILNCRSDYDFFVCDWPAVAAGTSN